MSVITNPVTVPRNHLFPPGPCEIAIGVGDTVRPTTGGPLGTAGSWEFLGTTREGGRAQEVLYTGNIPGDYSGSDGMPADIRLSGKGIVVVCQMQNFNPSTMRRLKSRYFGNFSGFDAQGTVDVGDIGSFLIQEYRYIPICIRSLNAAGLTSKYPGNEPGLFVPMCFPSGDMGWDYAAREQVYSLTFLGVMYVNMEFPEVGNLQTVDPHHLGINYNQGYLYDVRQNIINSIWSVVTNPVNIAV